MNARRRLGLMLCVSVGGLLQGPDPCEAQAVAAPATKTKDAKPTPEREAEEAVDALLKLVRRRLDVMHDVARTKWNAKTPVEDRARERAALDAVAAKAHAKGLDEAWTRAFFSAQIEAAKLIQRADLARWEAERRGPFADAPDLKRDLRPKIDALGDDLIAALAKARPWLKAKPIPVDVKARARKLVTGDGIDDRVRDKAIEPLVESSKPIAKP